MGEENNKGNEEGENKHWEAKGCMWGNLKRVDKRNVKIGEHWDKEHKGERTMGERRLKDRPKKIHVEG